MSHQILEMPLQIITHTNISNFPQFTQLHQSTPSLSSHIPIFLTLHILFAHPRPVNNQQIQIITLQSMNYLLASLHCLFIPLLCRSYFTRNKNITPLYFHIFQYLPNLLLIFVNTGRVNMSIPCLQSPPDSLQTLLSLQLISTITYDGYLVSRWQLNTWNVMNIHEYNNLSV